MQVEVEVEVQVQVQVQALGVHTAALARASHRPPCTPCLQVATVHSPLLPFEGRSGFGCGFGALIRFRRLPWRRSRAVPRGHGGWNPQGTMPLDSLDPPSKRDFRYCARAHSAQVGRIIVRFCFDRTQQLDSLSSRLAGWLLMAGQRRVQRAPARVSGIAIAFHSCASCSRAPGKVPSGSLASVTVSTEGITAQ